MLPNVCGGLISFMIYNSPYIFRDHAKLLWKRIPGDVKISNPEIGKLWELGSKLWTHSFTEVYSLIKETTWPPHIVPILVMLNGIII